MIIQKRGRFVSDRERQKIEQEIEAAKRKESKKRSCTFKSKAETMMFLVLFSATLRTIMKSL